MTTREEIDRLIGPERDHMTPERVALYTLADEIDGLRADPATAHWYAISGALKSIAGGTDKGPVTFDEAEWKARALKAERDAVAASKETAEIREVLGAVPEYDSTLEAVKRCKQGRDSAEKDRDECRALADDRGADLAIAIRERDEARADRDRQIVERDKFRIVLSDEREAHRQTKESSARHHEELTCMAQTRLAEVQSYRSELYRAKANVATFSHQLSVTGEEIRMLRRETETLREQLRGAPWPDLRRTLDDEMAARKRVEKECGTAQANRRQAERELEVEMRERKELRNLVGAGTFEDTVDAVKRWGRPRPEVSSERLAAFRVMLEDTMKKIAEQP